MPIPKQSFAQKSIFKTVHTNLLNSQPSLLELDPQDVDSKTPPDVIVTKEARIPVFDPTLGLPVAAQPPVVTANRLVAIGDSLTHGFQSGAIFNTSISYPAIIAYEMGWDSFRYPSYRGFGGLPLNIELLVRTLEAKFGAHINWWELAPAVFAVRQYMAEVEDWWERGAGSHVPQYDAANHNLAVYGWDVRDVLSRTGDFCESQVGKPKNQLFRQIVENANERAALRTLNFLTAQPSPARNQKTVLEQAVDLGKAEQIETLIVFVGANNALGTVLNLKVNWSDDGYDSLQKKSAYNVWRPTHFEKDFNLLVKEVEKINAQRVVFTTVPHVTIAPIARGVGDRKIPTGKPGQTSRYFRYYTRPWITDSQFDAADDPCLTAAEARAIDSAVDQYNYCIENTVRTARGNGLDWYLLDIAGMLDRLACRRYIDDINARPAWWTKYDLPPEFSLLGKEPDSQFFSTDETGAIVKGGLFSLDGVHPTTIAYGLVAQEFINIMQRAGVIFYMGDGTTPRTAPVRVDFKRLITLDTLIADPPRSVGADLSLIGWIDQQIDFVRRIFRTSGN